MLKGTFPCLSQIQHIYEVVFLCMCVRAQASPSPAGPTSVSAHPHEISSSPQPAPHTPSQLFHILPTLLGIPHLWLSHRQWHCLRSWEQYGNCPFGYKHELMGEYFEKMAGHQAKKPSKTNLKSILPAQKQTHNSEIGNCPGFGPKYSSYGSRN